MLTLRASPSRRRRFVASLRDETRARIARSAIVFAPHEDDETLGCGGTLLLKRDAGAAVACVFMTDGRTSHSAFMAADELCAVRRSEAEAATARLGVARENLHFLAIRDGHLRDAQAEAVQRVKLLITHYRPAELYVPLCCDGVPDHEATFSIVADAALSVGIECDILEYPVWAWNRWPWVSLKIGANRDTVRQIVRAMGTRDVRARLQECTTAIDIRAVRDEKREVLACYRSQMTVLKPGTRWPTLTDVSGGEFLECFFQDHEAFRCSRSGGAR